MSDDDDDSDPDDSWFDSMVDKKLDDLILSEALVDGLSPLLQDSQGMPEDFETPPGTPPKDDDNDSKVVSVRPVARPLQNWDEPILDGQATTPKIGTSSDAMVVDDSPPQVPQPFLTDAETLRAQRIAFLKAQLAELESSQDELISAGWGPGL